MSRISEAKVLNFGKNFIGKVSNFGYNLCPKSWKDFDDDWKKLNNLDIHNFRNNLGNLIIKLLAKNLGICWRKDLKLSGRSKN